MMKLNLNEREKVRFSKMFLEIAESANETAKAIQDGNDDEIFRNFIMLQLKFMSVKEFGDIAMQAALDKTNSSEEFPDVING